MGLIRPRCQPVEVIAALHASLARGRRLRIGTPKGAHFPDVHLMLVAPEILTVWVDSYRPLTQLAGQPASSPEIPLCFPAAGKPHD